MLRLHNPLSDPWREKLPSWLFALGEELTRVDQLLDDERFFAPFKAHFHPILGRPSIPIDRGLPALNVPETPLAFGL